MPSPPLRLNRIAFFVAPVASASEAAALGHTHPSETAAKLLAGVLNPILPNFGYEIRVANHVQNPHAARSLAVRRVLDADLVIFDITQGDSDICFDVGLRYASGRPMLAFAEKHKDVPCSLRHIDPIPYTPADIGETANQTWKDFSSRLHRIDGSDRTGSGRPIFEHVGEPLVLGGIKLTRDHVRMVEEALKRRTGHHAASRPVGGRREYSRSRFHEFA